jgi:hypothetical protein
MPAEKLKRSRSCDRVATAVGLVLYNYDPDPGGLDDEMEAGNVNCRWSLSRRRTEPELGTKSETELDYYIYMW